MTVFWRVTDGTLEHYVHLPGGSVNVVGGGFGKYEIQSVPHPHL